MTKNKSVYRQQGWGTITSYILSLLFFYIFISVSADVFQYLGFSPVLALLVLTISILTSTINIPIKTIESVSTSDLKVINFFGINYIIPDSKVSNKTVVAVNVGGAIIPLVVTIILMITFPNAIFSSVISIIIASIIINKFARPIKGLGIAIPSYIPALVSVLLTLLTTFNNTSIAAVVAYSTGVIGSLIGADILNLHKIPSLGAPVASIGGAGTFDGIFISGIFSVVLLMLFGYI